ncbi:hypothetical protein [Thalassorhabdomicrobium marinisediminis]|uniref:Transferrin-binding protein B C-lobe/N-lobe beta barrel domain-containing protein n=1 Tax=Thalassorhabdomicrobium marinisediminis TaxID=2170577 RepID=A0A2T7FZ28_9RHOB|nr:hypothetical protein [Thalassorhabdomicrobium marinisediminis]PVA07423.1 hypothetical protein DC363_06165 [Thalassorhabdomicrobium marinisediminis]
MRKTFALGALGAATLLSGCLSSGSNDRVDLEKVESLVDRANEASVAAVEDLPSNASMTGYVALSDYEDNEFIGDMSMNADFAGSTISGTASNFGQFKCDTECEDIDDLERVADLGGSLELTGGISGSEFDGSLGGDLTRREGGETGTATLALDVEGDFLMDDAGLIADAGLEGSATFDDEPDGIDLYGRFIVAE